MKTACFSGNRIHRLPFVFDEQNKKCALIKHRLEDEIKKAIARGYTHFIFKMDLGINMWAAEIVIKIKSDYPEIQLEAVLPYENQATHWQEDKRERYFNILAKCDFVKYISNRYTPTCDKLANTFMVNKSSLLIVAYDKNDDEINTLVNNAKINGLELVKIDLFDDYIKIRM